MWHLQRSSVVGKFLLSFNSIEAEVLTSVTVTEPNKCNLSRESSAISLFISLHSLKSDECIVNDNTVIRGPCDLDAPIVSSHSLTCSSFIYTGAQRPGICTGRQSFCVNQITGSTTNPGCEWSYSKVTCRAVGTSGGGK